MSGDVQAAAPVGDHRYEAPEGAPWGLCVHCKMAQAAHANPGEPYVSTAPRAPRRAPADVQAVMPNPEVPLCDDCVDAYRNGIEPGETHCEYRVRVQA